MRESTFIILLMILGFSAQAQIVNILDANFKSALINTNCVDTNGDGFYDSSADTNSDGEIQVSEAEAVLRLNVEYQNIASLEGIQSFVNLITLDCSSNELVELDITNLLALKELTCGYNDLTNLNVNYNLNLLTINCQANNFQTLDVSQNIDLDVINIGSNWNLTSLDISENVNLTALFSVGTSLTTLNTSQNPLLESLWLNQNKITTLDLSNNSLLRALFINSNRLVSLNIQNGNNFDMPTMQTAGNINLQCILVDDASASRPSCREYVGWCIDEHTVYSEDCEGLMVEDFTKREFVLFPNPVNNLLNIQSKTPVDNVKIYSVQGVLIKEVLAYNIDVSDLSPGVYFVEVMIADRKTIKKFIITRG